MTPGQWLDLVRTFGFPTAALIIVVIAFTREHVVPGSAYKRAIAERDAALARLTLTNDRVDQDLRDLRSRVEAKTSR